jgi:hydrogenase maturation protein HypF
MAASHLWSSRAGLQRGFDSFFAGIGATELAVWRNQFESGFNSPLTSSCGRLFDAVAALLGLRTRAVYEGQPATELEAIADANVKDKYGYDLLLENGVWIIDPAPAFSEIWWDLVRGRAVAEIAGAFHNTVAAWTVEIAARVRAAHGLSRVCLSGGCFQNMLLTDRVVSGLTSCGFEVYAQNLVPCNDGGVSLGQAAVAWALTQA